MSSPLKVLHVEDDDAEAFMFRESLRKAASAGSEYNILRVNSMAGAVDALKHQHFSVILLDLNLPDGRGIQTVQGLREQDPQTPIVVLTGQDDDDMAEEALQAGAQEYLVKNYSNGHVLKRILSSSVLRNEANKELYHRAHYDGLTGLPNQDLFRELSSAILSNAARWNRRAAFFFTDVNDFKSINDTYGHDTGDCVIAATATRLKSTLRKSDLVARYAGDEFVICIEGGDHPLTSEGCAFLAEKLLNEMNRPVCLNGIHLRIGISIGIAMYPECGTDYDALLKRADQAMYAAKTNGSSHYCIAGVDFVPAQEA